MKKCYLEYLSQFEVYLDHMSKSLKLSGHLMNENGNDEEENNNNNDDDDDEDDDDDYEIESNDYDDDPVDVNYQHHRRITDLKSASARRKKLLTSNSGHNSIGHNHHHNQSNINDLELDNLSDLSDNFTTNSNSSEMKKQPTTNHKTMASFRQISTDSEKGRSKETLSKRMGTSTNKIERVANNGGSYKMAWM